MCAENVPQAVSKIRQGKPSVKTASLVPVSRLLAVSDANTAGRENILPKSGQPNAPGVRWVSSPPRIKRAVTNALLRSTDTSSQTRHVRRAILVQKTNTIQPVAVASRGDAPPALHVHQFSKDANHVLESASACLATNARQTGSAWRALREVLKIPVATTRVAPVPLENIRRMQPPNVLYAVKGRIILRNRRVSALRAGMDRQQMSVGPSQGIRACALLDTCMGSARILHGK